MKKTYYIIMGFISIMIITLNNCSGGIGSAQQHHKDTPFNIFKDENGTKYLGYEGRSFAFKIVNNTIKEIEGSKYLSLEQKYVKDNNLNFRSSDRRSIDIKNIEKKLREDNLIDTGVMIQTMQLFNEQLDYSNHFLAFSNGRDWGGKEFHIEKKDDVSYVINEIHQFDDTDISGSYILINGKSYNVLSYLTPSTNSYDIRSIPVYENGNIVFYDINDFFQKLYTVSNDVRSDLYKYMKMGEVSIYQDGIYISYDKNANKEVDSDIMYKFIPFSLPETPTVLDIPL